MMLARVRLQAACSCLISCTAGNNNGLLCVQLMFLCGVGLTIGPSATLRFFMRRKNLKVGWASLSVERT